MLVVVSPAKRLDERPARAAGGTTPGFQDAAGELAGIAARMTGPELEKLMHISAKLGVLNAARFASFDSGTGAKQALEMFAGDTYAGLEAATLEPDELAYAQQNLRILSGLYGLLRPKDVIQPHRLEMGSRLENPLGRNLYAFWGGRIAVALNEQAAEMGAEVLVNCASVEYFSAVDLSVLKLRVITPVFMELRNGSPKIVAFYAKKARGAMARFIVQMRLQNPEGLREFDAGGYRFHPDMSEGNRWVFLRSDPDS